MEAVTSAPSIFDSFVIPRAGEFAPLVFVPRREIPKAVLAAEVDTAGWDVVNCIRVPVVNQAIVNSKRYPPSFSLKLNEAENWSIEGTFGAWQITQGGSGSILLMKLPIPNGSMEFGKDKLTFANGYALISIKLRYLPQEGSNTALRSAPENPLDVEKLLADAIARSGDDPAVVVQKVNYGDDNPSDVTKSLFEAAISLWLNSNLSAFSHIFAVVTLNQKATKKEYAWLKPTYTSYAYYQGLDEKGSYLGVLTQTEGRSVDELTNQVGGPAIPEDANASLLISQRLFFEKIILPGITKAFTKASSGSFQLVNLSQAIENTQNVEMDSIRVGAIDYKPIVTTFRLQIVGDEIQIYSKLNINVSPGIDVFVNATYFYQLGLTPKPDKSGMTMAFAQRRDPIIDSGYIIAEWLEITSIVIGIITSIVGAVVVAVTDKIKNLVLKLVVIGLITLVASVAAATPTIVAAALKDGTAAVLPPIGPLIDEASAPVEWTDAGGFKVSSAELNGAFVLGGTLTV